MSGATILYLLHFDRPIGRAVHYLGSTTETQLMQRVRQHQLGHGSRLTEIARLRRIAFWLATVIPVPSRDHERRIKTNGHFSKKCSVCLNHHQNYFPLELPLKFPAIEPELPFGLNFAQQEMHQLKARCKNDPPKKSVGPLPQVRCT